METTQKDVKHYQAADFSHATPPRDRLCSSTVFLLVCVCVCACECERVYACLCVQNRLFCLIVGRVPLLDNPFIIAIEV